MKCLIASNNAGKLTEYQHLLQPLNIEVIPQQEYNIPTADEAASTFVENALIKARHACQLSGLPALADDSGIEVSALDGAPGIFSARYAGEPSDASANNQKLLAAMQTVPLTDRHASFYCVIVYCRHQSDPTPLIAQGRWHGLIHDHAEGEHGFGYDPVFYLPEHSCTAAQLPAEIKNKVSHRAIACTQLIEQLEQLTVHG